MTVFTVQEVLLLFQITSQLLTLQIILENIQIQVNRDLEFLQNRNTQLGHLQLVQYT